MSLETDEREGPFPELPKLNRVLQAVELLGVSPSHGAGWELRKLRWYRDALFEHFAPFKVGDRVIMHTAYPIGRGSGWSGCEGMMQKGATGVVRKVDWTARELWDRAGQSSNPGEGAFQIRVRFDREWSVGREGQVFEVAKDRRHVFCFSNPERWWRRVGK